MLFKSQRNPRKSPTVATKAGARSSPLEISRWLGADNVEHLRATLSEAGVELTGAHTGQIVGQHFVADVHLDPDELIRVRCAVDLSDEPCSLLERLSGSGSAGCVRFALGVEGLHLAAETRVDGVAHLPHSLKEIREGFSLAFDSSARTAEVENTDEDSAASVRAAIEDCWPKDEAVATADGYELQPLIEGTRVSVQVLPRPGAALVQRAVLPELPEGIAGSAIAHQALVWNARLRCCRLAIGHSRLCIESRLHVRRIDAEWISFTARAVAAAARTVEPELDLLARDPDVAQAYADMFGIVPTAEPDN